MDRVAAAGEYVENHIGGVHTLADGLGAGRLDRRQPIAEHGGEDVHHLSIAIAVSVSLRRTRSIAAGNTHP